MDNAHAPKLRQDGYIVVIGASAGGIQSLVTLLGGLPADFPAPIVIVQHRSPTHDSLLTRILGSQSRLRVEDAVEGEALAPGVVYVARPDRHLTITSEGRFSYWDGARIRFVQSSANPLFESAAVMFGTGAIGVVLSGSGTNGTDGVQAIKARGGAVIAQNKATSERFEMPASAIRAGAVDEILPIEDIAPALVRLVSNRPQRDILNTTGREAG